MLTGDLAADEDGYITFPAATTTLITSSGYRIGPAEIEDCPTGHPAVQMAAAVGKPDALRTEIVKATRFWRQDFARDALAAEIRDWVKMRLSMHEYPRVRWRLSVDALPLTTSGKVIRRMLAGAGGGGGVVIIICAVKEIALISATCLFDFPHPSRRNRCPMTRHWTGSRVANRI